MEKDQSLKDFMDSYERPPLASDVASNPECIVRLAGLNSLTRQSLGEYTGSKMCYQEGCDLRGRDVAIQGACLVVGATVGLPPECPIATIPGRIIEIDDRN